MPPDNFRIRATVPRDAPGVITLLDILGAGDRDRRLAVFAELQGNPLYSAFIALDGEVPVGFVDLWELPDLLHEARLGYAVTMVVQRGRQGEGIGTALLEHVLRVARDKGLAEMHVSTGKDNARARKLAPSPVSMRRRHGTSKRG